MKSSLEYETQKEFKEFIENDNYTIESIAHDLPKNEQRKHFIRELLLWIRAFIFVIIIVLIVRGFLGEPVKVIGPSMENTLKSGDILIMSKIGFEINGLERNDIVVIEIEPVTFKNAPFLDNIVWFRRLFPTKLREDYIKRVIAFENEEVNIINGTVYINGKRHDEPYLKDIASTYEKLIDFPYTVPEGHIFVMGDNRILSKDSRSIGSIPIDDIIGKVVFRTWPINKFGPIN